MAKNAWPTAAEVQSFLEGLGVSTIPPGVDLDGQVAEAVGAFHRIAMVKAYLAEESAAFDFNPPRTRLLDLGHPFFAVSDVKVGKSASDAGSSITDQIAWWGKPFGGPYRYIEFRDAQYGEPESLEVTGRRGVTDDIPVDLWNAVRNHAAGGVYRFATITGVVTAGVPKRIKQGGVEIQYGSSSSGSSGSSSNFADGLQEAAEAVFRRHRVPFVAGVV